MAGPDDYLDPLLKQDVPIVFFAESPNRSHTLSMAAQRGSLDNLWASSLYPMGNHVQVGDQLNRCHDHPGAHSRFQDLLSKKNLNHFTDPAWKNLRLEADATQMREFFDQSGSRIPTSNIWVQCPWTYRRDMVADLLKSIVRSAADVQDEGHCLFLGLVNENSDFYFYYDWEHLTETAAAHGYEYRFRPCRVSGMVVLTVSESACVN